MRVRASYEVMDFKGHTVTIRDLDVGVSITNDAEAVVARLYDTYGNVKMLYYDTQGELTELVHEHGIFTGFAVPRDTKQADASRARA